MTKMDNEVWMGLSFSAMIRLYEKKSKPKIHKLITKILDEISLAESKDQFDKYHEKFCNWGVQNIYLAERIKKKQIIKKRGPASYGQIAKTLDVVLKVVIHYCYWPNKAKSDELSKWLNAAVDNKMMRMLKKEYPDFLITWPNNVEGVKKSDYKKLQQAVKLFIQERHGGMILPVNFDDIYWNILNRKVLLNPT